MSFDVDSYEQLIERPTDYKVEKKHYSGKQEKYRLEKQNNCDAFWLINGLCSSYRNWSNGQHKIWIYRGEEGNPEQKFQGDKAYVGEPLINTPHKKLEVKILQMLRIKKINTGLEKLFCRTYSKVGEYFYSSSRKISLKIWQLWASNSAGMWINKMAEWCNS